MNIYEFMIEMPWLSFCLAILPLYPICRFLYLTYRVCHVVLFCLPNRMLRSRNIRKSGWPPEHCDADGDFRPVPAPPEETEE